MILLKKTSIRLLALIELRDFSLRNTSHAHEFQIRSKVRHFASASSVCTGKPRRVERGRGEGGGRSDEWESRSNHGRDAIDVTSFQRLTTRFRCAFTIRVSLVCRNSIYFATVDSHLYFVKTIHYKMPPDVRNRIRFHCGHYFSKRGSRTLKFWKLPPV